MRNEQVICLTEGGRPLHYSELVEKIVRSAETIALAEMAIIRSVSLPEMTLTSKCVTDIRTNQRQTELGFVIAERNFSNSTLKLRLISNVSFSICIKEYQGYLYQVY